MTDQLWHYQAEDERGEIHEGEVSALSRSAVQQQLEDRQLLALRIKPLTDNQKAVSFRIDSVTIGKNRHLSLRDHADWTRGLADLLVADIPVAEALALLVRRQKKTPVQKFLRDLLQDLRAGKPLASALQASRMQVPRMVTALVEAGEASGTLGRQLDTVAQSLERNVTLRRELIGQLIYPAALMVLVFLTMLFLAHVVLPQFEQIFANAEATPPPETRIVLAAGAWLRDFGMVLPLAMLLVVWGVRQLHQRNSYAFSRYFVHFPSVGAAIQKFEAGRFCRSLGSLVSGGLSLSQALPIAIRAVSSSWLREQYELAASGIRAGISVSASLEQQGLANDDVIALAEIGESTGQLGPMMIRAAQLCEDDVRAILTRLTALAGPLLTALMGLVTAGVIASVMTGVLSLNDAIY